MNIKDNDHFGESVLGQATRYTGLGLSIIPVPHGQKRPAYSWKEHQSRLAMEHELPLWFDEQDQGMGIVCGKISGNLVCLDFDDMAAYEHFVGWINNKFTQQWTSIPPGFAPFLYPQLAGEESILRLPTASTSRGRHVFFRTPKPVKSCDLYLEGYEAKAGDLLSEGKFAVLPPTVHPTGHRREWLNPLGNEIPILKLEELGIIKKPVSLELIYEGSRHNKLMELGSKLTSAYPTMEKLEAVLGQINQARCEPPLPVTEVEEIARFLSSTPGNHSHSLKRIESDESKQSLDGLITSYIAKENESDFDDIFLAAPDYMRQREEEPLEWLVQNLFPLSYLVVLGATSKAGKSCLVSYMANKVCQGEEFLGLATQQSSVLWLSYEESEAERAMILKNYQPLPTNLYITHEKLKIDEPKGIQCIRHWIRRTGAKLLVVDPLYCAVSAESLSDGRKARVALESLKDLCRDENIVAIVLHHFTKNVSLGSSRERFADSNQILAAASMDLIMETSKLKTGGREIRLVGTGRGAFANYTHVIHSDSPYQYDLVASGLPEDLARQDMAASILEVLSHAPNGLTSQEITDALQGNTGTTRNRLTQLVRDGKITVIGMRGPKKVYGADLRLRDGGGDCLN